MTTDDSAGSARVTGERLVVALVRGLHGLNGAVRVEILTDHPEERYAPGSILYREGSDEPLTVAWSSSVADGPGWRLRFEEITTRDAADALRGAYLEWVANPDAELGRGEYFWHEVIGAAVRGTDGAELGTVRDVYRSGGAEVFLVDGGPYGEFDVPAVRAFVRVFAPRRGEIVVDTEALDLKPPRSREGNADRPKAPRRRPGPRRKAPRREASDGPPATDGPVPEA
ncbi:MAG: ribosome maturation factor RimM [Chloroflexota bacterium]